MSPALADHFIYYRECALQSYNPSASNGRITAKGSWNCDDHSGYAGTMHVELRKSTSDGYSVSASASANSSNGDITLTPSAGCPGGTHTYETFTWVDLPNLSPYVSSGYVNINC